MLHATLAGERLGMLSRCLLIRAKGRQRADLSRNTTPQLQALHVDADSASSSELFLCTPKSPGKDYVRLVRKLSFARRPENTVADLQGDEGLINERVLDKLNDFKAGTVKCH